MAKKNKPTELEENKPTELEENKPVELDGGETLEVTEDDNKVTDTEDGGAIVQLEEENLQRDLKHFANICDEVDPSDLSIVVNDLLDKIERDKKSREKRDKLYEEGLRRTGLGDDAPGGASFNGANKVVHPMLVQACVDFSARVMKEIFPANGPVKSKIIGKADQAKLEKAQRKADFMNWQCTQQIVEMRGELEQLATQLPLGGAQYMQIYWNAKNRRPSVEFVAIDDIYLPFAATNFYTAERKTRVEYLTKYKYQERVKSGMYSDVDLGEPDQLEFSKASLANDKIEGREESSYNEDGLRIVFNIYTSFAIEDDGEVRPYVITIDKSTQKCLCLYRNWEVDDDHHLEMDWIVEFPFIPWRGAYPIGLTHMVGGLSGAATGALRALLDSAHIQNIPTMLKLKGGPNGQTINLQPTEVVEIEGGALVDDVRKIAMPLPFNPPSQVLFQLLGFLVDAGQRVVQTSFEKLSDGNPNMPVGTTVALIEQGMVVFSSIHSRLHSSVERMLKVIHRINSAYLTKEDIDSEVTGFEVIPSDFDGPLDVIPVSDPSIFSETQRFAQTQAVMQRAAMMPQLYNQRKIEKMFLDAMKLPSDILNPEQGKDDMDPVSENVAASMGGPIYVLPKQDHISHLKLHMAFLQSPVFGSNPAIVKTFLYPMAMHLRDHLLNYYLVQTQQGVKVAIQGGVIEDNAVQEAQMVAQVQRMIETELQGFAQLLPAIDAEAQKYAPRSPGAEDQTMQIAQMNIQAQQQRLQLEQAKMQQQGQLDQAKMQHQGQLEQVKMQHQTQLQQSKLVQDAQFKQQAAMLALKQEELRQAQENLRLAHELETRERINASDNDTAMMLAAAEITTGEKFAVSTGTGINPGG